MGQSEELLRRNVSTQSGWKICRHGNSRTCVSFGSKSSRHIGHVGWEKLGDVPFGCVVANGAEERRVKGIDFEPVSASTFGERFLCTLGGVCGKVFSGSRLSVDPEYVYIGNFSRKSCGTVNRFTPTA